MLCQKCEEYGFFLDIEKNIVNSKLIVPLDLFENYAIVNRKEDMTCDSCTSYIYRDDLYLEDVDTLEEVKDEIYSKISEIVMGNIQSCQECGHGSFMQGLKYSIDSIFDDDDDDPDAIFSEYNSSTELKDLIYEVSNFDEKHYEDIVEHIECPNCDNGSGIDYHEKVDHGDFDLNTEVYTKSDIMYFENYFYGDPYGEIKQDIEELANICTFEELEALRNDYIKNQFFVTKNEVFNKILTLINGLYNKGFYYTPHRSKRIYRARVNESEQLYPVTRMWEPPLEDTRQNRYNVSGMPVLYCANSKEVLHKEVQNSGQYGYTFATMRILKPLKFFKINPIFGFSYQGFIDEPVPSDIEKKDFKMQYIITNIIALIAKDVGYNGIVYYSVKDSDYVNYAIFSYEKNIDIDIVELSSD
ncbi:hypothetical protein [Paenibacillus gansuensis]|uniref:RES domain-containing protein n=1 Tax=Paenibacillus gansuensis TaxID=306542 RepID=A0ABW5PA99_9BACL